MKKVLLLLVVFVAITLSSCSIQDDGTIFDEVHMGGGEEGGSNDDLEDEGSAPPPTHP